MRRATGAFVALFLALPVAVAAVQATLVSDSPAFLHGRIEAVGAGRVLYHHAFSNTSLVMQIHNGTVIDRHLHRVCDGSYREEEHVIASSSGDPTRLLTLTAVLRSMLVYEFDAKSAAEIHGRGTSQGPDAPDAYLGPNPYNLTTDGRSAPSPRLQWARSYPVEPFFLVPRTTLETDADGTLYLEAGALRIAQGGSQFTMESKADYEDVAACGFGPVPPPPGATDRVPFWHSIRVHVSAGQMRAEQSGLDGLLEFYQGDRGVQDPEGGPHRGYARQGDLKGIEDTYVGFALPATSLEARDLSAKVTGIVEVADGAGSLRDDGVLTEVRRDPLRLAGAMTIKPIAQDEGGRRMQAEVSGDFVITDAPASPGATQDYAPLLMGVGLGVVGFGVGFALWPTIKWRFTQWMLFPLYARLKKEEILENPLRDDILQVVSESPGISASELGRRVDCGWGTLVYHLTVLERMQLLSSAREGRHKRFFVQGRINYSDKGAVGLLANPAARTILDAVRATPGVIQRDLGDRLGLSAGTIAWHIERLVAQGLVVREEDGRTVRYFPSERLLELTKRLAA